MYIEFVLFYLLLARRLCPSQYLLKSKTHYLEGCVQPFWAH